MKRRYSPLIWLTTIEGIKKAEWYHVRGWKIASQGLQTIQFYQ